MCCVLAGFYWGDFTGRLEILKIYSWLCGQALALTTGGAQGSYVAARTKIGIGCVQGKGLFSCTLSSPALPLHFFYKVNTDVFYILLMRKLVIREMKHLLSYIANH